MRDEIEIEIEIERVGRWVQHGCFSESWSSHVRSVFSSLPRAAAPHTVSRRSGAPHGLAAKPRLVPPPAGVQNLPDGRGKCAANSGTLQG